MKKIGIYYLAPLDLLLKLPSKVTTRIVILQPSSYSATIDQIVFIINSISVTNDCSCIY
jgi:hypothetical protein